MVKTDKGNKYNIDNISQKSLNLISGNTYRFIQSDMSNNTHPLNLSRTKDGSHHHSMGTPYRHVTISNDGNKRIIEVVVNINTPNLYYYCENHPGMGSSISFKRYGRGFRNSRHLRCGCG